MNTFFYLNLSTWATGLFGGTFSFGILSRVFFLGLFQYDDAGSSLVPTRWESWSGNVTKLDGTGVGQQIVSML